MSTKDRFEREFTEARLNGKDQSDLPRMLQWKNAGEDELHAAIVALVRIVREQRDDIRALKERLRDIEESSGIGAA